MLGRIWFAFSPFSSSFFCASVDDFILEVLVVIVVVTVVNVVNVDGDEEDVEVFTTSGHLIDRLAADVKVVPNAAVDAAAVAVVPAAVAVAAGDGLVLGCVRSEAPPPAAVEMGEWNEKGARWRGDAVDEAAAVVAAAVVIIVD